MKIMSYSLFGNDGRYWNMVYPVLVINASVYKTWVTRFHISKNELNHPFYPFIKKLSDNTSQVQIDVHEESFQNLEGTFWRLKPLWDHKSDYVFCKDLDTMPTSIEIKAMWKFMCKGNIIHGIRSHPLHTINLLAGLCGFNCAALRSQDIMRGGFSNYMHKFRQRVGRFDWGCDQRALADFFHSNEATYLQGHTIDTPTRDAPKKLRGYNPLQLADSEYDCDINSCAAFPNIDLELLSWMDSKIRYEGMAYGVQGDDYEMIQTRNGDDLLKMIQDYRKGIL